MVPIGELRLVQVVNGRAQAEDAKPRLREMLSKWGQLDRTAQLMLSYNNTGGMLVVFRDYARWYFVDITRVTPETAGFAKIEAHWRAGTPRQSGLS